jgi:hypothetical protein
MESVACLLDESLQELEVHVVGLALYLMTQRAIMSPVNISAQERKVIITGLDVLVYSIQLVMEAFHLQ